MQNSLAARAAEATRAMRARIALVCALLSPASVVGDELVLERLATVGQPTDLVTDVDDGRERLFIVSQAGQIWIFDSGSVSTEPFLDLGNRIAFGPEQGLLSMVFGPRDSAFGARIYVTYTRSPDGASVVSRFEIDPESPDRLDPSREEVLLVVPQPGPNHNVNQLRFGPDGYLYIAIGDGALAVEPSCASQQGDVLLGKILRLDTEVAVGYRIPADNPFVEDASMRDEVWALGLRNPWRLSFDRANGDLFIADPGQQGASAREEINRIPNGTPGGYNFGWKMMVGTTCRGIDHGCASPVPACHDARYAPPVIEYLHDTPSRCAVIGGFVYRGMALPALTGSYVFGDFCGQLWIAWPTSEGWDLRAVGPDLFGITTLGEDAAGELLIATIDGNVYRVVGADLEGDCQPDDETLCLGGGRFRARVAWRTSTRAGTGRAVPLDPDGGGIGTGGGWFWFFRPGNPEVFVKVLDACETASRHHWVYAGGLTDVGVDLEVVDTATGAVRHYVRDRGTPFGTIRDTRAFATCTRPPRP